MHAAACLNEDEIVRLIALELVASGGEATAVGLACCCKGFEDPVLDTLWAEQVSLLPLLKTLPSGVWKEGGYSVSASTPCLFFLSLTTRFESPLKGFRRRRNGPASGSMLEGYKNSKTTP